MLSDTAVSRVSVCDLTIEYPRRIASIRKPGSASKHVALEGISFSLRPGDRLGLLGRNGSGKSTLLRALAGVYPPTKGSLTIQGSIAAIFNASLGFFHAATGRENIFLRGLMLGLDFRTIKSLVPEIIEFSELDQWIDRPISQYSSGMALRLAFAITTAIRSDILLLDEWLGAGDVGFLAKAQHRMEEMVRDASILVLATHNLNLMRGQCSHALVLEDGHIQYIGEIEQAIGVYQELRRLEQT